MIKHLSKQLNSCLYIYEKLGVNYFKSLMAPLLILISFSVGIGFLLACVLFYIETLDLGGEIGIFNLIFLFYKSLYGLTPGILVMVFALFTPYLWSTLIGGKGRFDISKAFKSISSEKWGMFLGFLFIYALSGLFSIDTPDWLEFRLMGFYDTNEEMIQGWLGALFLLIRRILPFAFATILAQINSLTLKEFKLKLKALFISVVLMISLHVLMINFMESIWVYLLGLLSIVFEDFLIIELFYAIFIFFLYLYTFPAMIALLTGGNPMKATAEINEKVL